MKKVLFVLSVCCLLFGCRPEDPVEYPKTIVGSWKITDVTIEISGVTGDKYVMIHDEMVERFETWEGKVFDFRSDNIISDKDGGVESDEEGVWELSDNRLRMSPPDDPGEQYDLTIVKLANRSLVMTFDAVAEWPQLAVLMPELTKCLVTIEAAKRNVNKPLPDRGE